MHKTIKFRCPQCGEVELDRKVACEATESNVALSLYRNDVVVDHTKTYTDIDQDTIQELYYECASCCHTWDTMEELADDNALHNEDGVPVDINGAPKA